MFIDDCGNRWDCSPYWKRLHAPRRFLEGADIKLGVRRPGQTVCFTFNRNNDLCHLCNHQTWHPHVEACDDDLLPKCVAAAFKALKNDIVVQVVN